MELIKDNVFGTVTLKGVVEDGALAVTAMQDGCEGGKIVVRFDRYKHCGADVLAIITMALTLGKLDEERIIGKYDPLEMTESERLAIYDYRHDEICEP